MSRGKYIVIEGIDGSGKTTQFGNLINHFGEDKTLGVREPGGTIMGERIRTILKDKAIPRATQTNLFLFSAARIDLIETTVRPAIRAGKNIVSDRNWVSTLAYQSAEGVDPTEIIQLSELATGDLYEPDLLIFLDVDPALCRKRLEARGGSETDYFDQKGIEYFDRVREAYLAYVAAHTKNRICIDGDGTPHEVWQRVLSELQERGL